MNTVKIEPEESGCKDQWRSRDSALLGQQNTKRRH
jgi:hypothetical protein